jgi:hypothetical protein
MITLLQYFQSLLSIHFVNALYKFFAHLQPATGCDGSVGADTADHPPPQAYLQPLQPATGCDGSVGADNRRPSTPTAPSTTLANRSAVRCQNNLPIAFVTFIDAYIDSVTGYANRQQHPYPIHTPSIYTSISTHLFYNVPHSLIETGNVGSS